MILKNKVIVVTGGSGLIGKSIQDDLRKKGATVYNLDIAAGEESEKYYIQCDIRSGNEFSDSLNKVFEKESRIDGLVNNAYPRTKNWGVSFLSIEPEELRSNVDWQLNAYILCCQAFIKLAINKKQTISIVNIASIYGVVGNDFTIYEGTNIEPPAAYSAIKGGLINFSRFLASKYGQNNIRVNCVSPGGVFDGQDEKFVKAYEKRVPMKRMAQPSDIAPGVSFMLSDDAKYITGQNLIIDGGWTAI